MPKVAVGIAVREVELLLLLRLVWQLKSSMV